MAGPFLFFLSFPRRKINQVAQTGLHRHEYFSIFHWHLRNRFFPHAGRWISFHFFPLVFQATLILLDIFPVATEKNLILCKKKKKKNRFKAGYTSKPSCLRNTAKYLIPVEIYVRFYILLVLVYVQEKNLLSTVTFPAMIHCPILYWQGLNNCTKNYPNQIKKGKKLADSCLLAQSVYSLFSSEGTL